MLKLKLDNLKNSLSEYDFTNEQINIVINELTKGINIEVMELNSVDIKMNNANIQLNGEILTTDKFKCDISGLDSTKILSIKLPVLDYSISNVFTIDVKYYPFDLSIGNNE